MRLEKRYHSPEVFRYASIPRLGEHSDRVGSLRALVYGMVNQEGHMGPSKAKDAVLPFDTSVGYQIRLTHRLVQRYLQQEIEPHGVTLGMWYFLRALWHEDGLTQRELSEIVGTMEPTTLTAIRSMEAGGLVKRVRSTVDRRKINIFLTPRGRSLRGRLLPLARDVVEDAVDGFSDRDRKAFLKYLGFVQQNMRSRIQDVIADAED